ncbi:glycosyltransferase family 2 protein [Novosphingobium mangrovi (ex Huang et al. 2023)]|uniref:Glycosyltransferase family 2 protein n=1 Tax=Novosphingobium mangrovi (ex Huang et al. 2023) TaxID=2976432 RepID=A0ABT2I164_9SPHN|nr:glycosyltransferase family 2 protein [Novosphingobium mangrovi (ex Huang et al. 2023)]MCT2398398.1 glycosyltransferase family 2 protein [Novosphingobium mangrovi (ex Huang et al. 2023)]
MNPAITVVIPVYNAEQTIMRTLSSIQAQTVGDLEIRVVDDGSQDATAAIVEGVRAQDSRVVCLRQANAGVAAARNTGMEGARGRFTAFCDGDDIWHPQKLERQIAALEADPGAGLCYSWYRRIDAHDCVLPVSPAPRIEGAVLYRHLEWNFISNGSTVLVPTPLARRTGFEPALRDAGNQGCEDYLFQLRIAQAHRFVCVPAYLVGYRMNAQSMSRGVDRMIRSHLQTYAIMEESLPADRAVAKILARRRAKLLVELFRNRVRRADLPAAVAALAGALRAAPRLVPGFVMEELREGMARSGRARTDAGDNVPPPLRPFQDFGPEEPDGSWRSRRSPAYLAWLGELDAAQQPAAVPV